MGIKMKAPTRIQRTLSRSIRPPENSVYVGQGSAFDNPYPIRKGQDAQQAKKLYEQWVMDPRRSELRQNVRTYLKGKNLICWCSLEEPCHADVLLGIANGCVTDAGAGE